MRGGGVVLTKSIVLAVAVILIVAAAMPLSGEVYTWKEKNGNIVISTSPPPGGNAQKPGTEKAAAQTTPTPAPTPTPTRMEPPAGQRGNADIRVIMYKTEWCPYCKKARDDLKALGVHVTEYDIERDRSKNDEMRRKGGTAVPFIDVEGIYVHGYSAAAIKAAVERRRNAG
jgi:mycoredoxin